MILEVLLFFYTLIVVPFHKLKNLWKRYYICEVMTSDTDGTSSNDKHIVITVGNFKMNTDYKLCRVGEGMYFEGNYYSNKSEKVETLTIDEEF
jgi:hypothetical protein